MKTSATIKNKKNAPSLFRIAAQIEDPAIALPVKPATTLNQAPASRGSAKPAAQAEAAKKHGDDEWNRSRSSLIETEFKLEAPQAVSVKLAADFTDWEKSPIDMDKLEDGVWHALIPLPPGEHSYRFIVDGQWCDDPHSAICVPNPFGTVNAVMRVA